MYVQRYHQAGRNADSQSADIDDLVDFVSGEGSEGEGEVAF